VGSLLGKWCILPKHHTRLSRNITLRLKLLFSAKVVNKRFATAVDNTWFGAGTSVGSTGCCHIEKLASGSFKEFIGDCWAVVLEVLPELMTCGNTLAGNFVNKIAVSVTAITVVGHVIPRLVVTEKLVSLYSRWDEIITLERVHF